MLSLNSDSAREERFQQMSKEIKEQEVLIKGYQQVQFLLCQCLCPSVLDDIQFISLFPDFVVLSTCPCFFQENEKLYMQLKAQKTSSKANEGAMFSENQRLLSELALTKWV